jgi:hypothetical protein
LNAFDCSAALLDGIGCEEVVNALDGVAFIFYMRRGGAQTLQDGQIMAPVVSTRRRSMDGPDADAGSTTSAPAKPGRQVAMQFIHPAYSVISFREERSTSCERYPEPS